MPSIEYDPGTTEQAQAPTERPDQLGPRGNGELELSELERGKRKLEQVLAK